MIKNIYRLFVLSFTLQFGYAVSEGSDSDFVEKLKHEDVVFDDFYDRQKHFQHTFSPSGKYLAFIEYDNSNYNLAITDLEKYEIVEYQPISKGYPRDLVWVSDRRLLFNLNGKVFAINRDGTDLRILIDNVYDEEQIKGYYSFKKNFRLWRVASTLPADDEHILVKSTDINGFENVDKVNIYTGDIESICNGSDLKINTWIIDFDGNVTLGVRRKKGEVSFYSYDSEANKIHEVKSKKTKYDFDYDGRSYLEKRVLVNGFSYEENKFYITENLDTERFRLSLFNYIEGSSSVILEDSVYDVGDSYQQATLLYDHPNKKLAGIRYQAEKEKTVWYNEKLSAIQRKLDKAYPGKINTIFDWTENFGKVLVWSRDNRKQGRILIFLPENKSIIQTLLPPKIDEKLLGAVQTVKIKTRDNYEYEGYLTLPANYKEGKLPLVVVPHGGPWVRSYYGFDADIQLLAFKGFAVFEPNFRGSIGYGRTHLLAGKGSIEGLMIDDIADGTKWLIKNNIADPDKVYIMGFSYGGYAAIMSSIRYPDLYKAAASYSSPLDIKTQLKDYQKDDNYFAYEFWDELIIGEKDKKKKQEAISPSNQIEKIKIPLLVFHGEEDDVISVKQVEKFKEKAKKNKNVKVTILKSEGHGIELKSNQIYFMEKVIDHFTSN